MSLSKRLAPRLENVDCCAAQTGTDQGPALHLSLTRLEHGEGGDHGGLDAQYAGAEMDQDKTPVAQQSAITGRPATLGTEGQHGSGFACNRGLGQGGGGFVIVEGQADAARGQGVDHIGERQAV